MDDRSLDIIPFLSYYFLCTSYSGSVGDDRKSGMLLVLYEQVND